MLVEVVVEVEVVMVAVAVAMAGCTGVRCPMVVVGMAVAAAVARPDSQWWL